MVGGSMNGKTNNPPGGYSMEVVTLRPPFCFACAYSRNVWQMPRTGDALPGGKVDLGVTLGQILPDVNISQQPLPDAPGAFGAVSGFYCGLGGVAAEKVGFTKSPLPLVHRVPSPGGSSVV